MEDDIPEVPIAELRDNGKQYRGKQIRIKEFPVFVYAGAVYPDYYLAMGSKGGCRVCYGEDKKLHLTSTTIHGSTSEGIRYKNSNAWLSSLILPSLQELPDILRKLETETHEKVQDYTRTLENAKARLQTLEKLTQEYPEYSM